MLPARNALASEFILVSAVQNARGVYPSVRMAMSFDGLHQIAARIAEELFFGRLVAYQEG